MGLEELRHSILNSVRITILIFIFSKIEKEKLLCLLDDSLLDVAVNKELDVVAKKCSVIGNDS